MLDEYDIRRNLRDNVRMNKIVTDEYGDMMVELRDVKFECVTKIMMSLDLLKDEKYDLDMDKYHESYDAKIFGTEQVEKCKETLRRSYNTRQAIISFTRTDVDPYPYSCGQYVHYMWKDQDNIDAYVYWRSEDAVRYALDFQYIDWLSKQVTPKNVNVRYIWHVGSFHLYQKFFKFLF